MVEHCSPCSVVGQSNHLDSGFHGLDDNLPTTTAPPSSFARPHYDVQWLLYVSASTNTCDGEYLDFFPIATNELIFCLICEIIVSFSPVPSLRYILMLQKVHRVLSWEAYSRRRLGTITFETSEGRENGGVGECCEGDWLGAVSMFHRLSVY